MDIFSRLQTLSPGRFRYELLTLVDIDRLSDTMGTGIVSFMLSKLGKEWGLQPAQLGWVVSIAFIGMALGVILSGWLTDRLGRGTAFATTMAVHSVATGLYAFAPDTAALLTCRFFVGVGLGEQLPAMVSLVSEHAPPRICGRFIVLLKGLWGLGWLATTLASYFSAPEFDWHNTFLIGMLPILYIPLVLKLMPESIPYLLSQGKTDGAHRLISRLEGEAGITPAATTVASPQKEK